MDTWYTIKLNTELINNLNQIKSHPQQKLDGKDLGKRDANTRTTHNVKSQVFQNRAGLRLGLAAWLSREIQPQDNWTASCPILSCSAIAGMTVQFLYMLGTCATSSSLQAASYTWDPVASPYFFAQSWAFLHTLSHTTLTWFPLKCRVTNC